MYNDHVNKNDPTRVIGIGLTLLIAIGVGIAIVVKILSEVIPTIEKSRDAISEATKAYEE